jgi:hypothetical protein
MENWEWGMGNGELGIGYNFICNILDNILY